jgi:hypothetical protein
MKARVEVGKNLQWGSSSCFIKGGLAHDVCHTDSELRLSSIQCLIHSSLGFGKDFLKGLNFLLLSFPLISFSSAHEKEFGAMMTRARGLSSGLLRAMWKWRSVASGRRR